MNKQELINELTEYKERYQTDTDSYYQGRHSAYNVALKLVEKLDEPQKVKIPQFVAEWIEYVKKKGDCLYDSFKPWDLYGMEYVDVERWIDNNGEIYAQAWLDGYEVEKQPDPLFRVELPYLIWNEEAAELQEQKIFLGLDITSDESQFVYVPNQRTDFRTDLTEVQIKSMDERYWAFAVPVDADES